MKDPSSWHHDHEHEEHELRETVLVVDDFHAVRAVYRRGLEAAGLHVREVADARGALDVISRSRPGAVVLDASRTDSDGYSLLATLRDDAALATLPVLLITRHDEATTALRAGADDILREPFRPEELVARVQSLLRKQHAWRFELNQRMAARSAQLDALGQVEPGTAVGETATSLVDALYKVGGIEAVAIIGLADGHARLLAGAPRSAAPIPGPLPPSVARHLDIASRMEPCVADVLEAETTWADAPNAFAPLRRGGTCFGFLAVRISAWAGAGLATAIDLAAPIAGLLAGELVGRAADANARAEIDDLLATGRFHPVFQPVVSLVDRTPLGFEALTRFDDGSRPDVRFGEAARVGRGTQLELATMRRACADAVCLDGGAWLSLNVSPTLLRHPDLLAQEVEDLDRPIVLELTEREAIDDYDALRSMLGAVPGHPKLAIDDAGAGYASLRHILQLHPEFIKLDATWVQGIDTDPARQALIAGLQLFAAESDMTLIAEGVETPSEAITLLDLGLDYAQGYLFGKPEPVTAAAP
jgi:EAL domain-containing protein (putative c-di-GMP-specific phosphodiesterase class I)/CheY-like chemotaxis protein